MSVPESRKNDRRICSCGCNRQVTRTTDWRHRKKERALLSPLVVRLETPPPPKRRRIAHSQAPPFEFNPSLPLLDPPPASSAGDALTEASVHFVDNVLLDLQARTHRTTDQNSDEDSEDALEGDAVEAPDFVDDETGDFWNGEDVAMEGDADLREGVVSDWDLLAEKFIVEAEELGKSEHSLLHAP
jgi:hypothetical protein